MFSHFIFRNLKEPLPQAPAGVLLGQQPCFYAPFGATTANKSPDLSAGQIRRFFVVRETMLCYNIRENIVDFFTFSFVYNDEQEVKGKTVMKTKEELNALKEEVETLNKKLADLSEDELKQVAGGVIDGGHGDCALVPPQL